MSGIRGNPVAKFLVPDWGDIAESGIRLSYRPASLMQGQERLSKRGYVYRTFYRPRAAFLLDGSPSSVVAVAPSCTQEYSADLGPVFVNNFLPFCKSLLLESEGKWLSKKLTVHKRF